MPKPSRSAFYFFASEYQRRHERAHGHRISINEAINSCYDDWKILTDEEKQPYKDLYERWRAQYRTDPTSMLESNQQVNQRKVKKQENILRQRDIPCEQLKMHFDRFSIERDLLAFEYLPLDLQELLYMPIYIINFQIFCKVDEEDGGQYVPAELAFVRYTLAEGVTLCRHIFIKPERFPTGYMSACLEHLKDTHQIPLRGFAQATDQYSMIYEQIKSVIIRDEQSIVVNSSESDDRERRRSQRSRQPCLFFPAVEYEQTAQLFDWLQTKAEGVKPSKDTRLVSFASVESLIMLLAELKQQRVCRDDIQKTFENAAYSYMIEDRCSYHLHLGISHCSVVRCYAVAKLIGAYLNQLYVPERTVLATMNSKRTLNSAMKKSDRVSVVSMNTTSHRESSPSATSKPSMMNESALSSQYSTTAASDSIASSYRGPVQMKKSSEPTSTSVTHREPSAKYSNQSKQMEDSITNDLIHHPTIMKLQQQNFNRLISSVTSTASSSSSVVEQQKPATNLSNAQPTASQRTNFSSRLSTPMGEHSKVNQPPTSDDQRTVLNQRKQALLQAIRNIDQQMEELNM